MAERVIGAAAGFAAKRPPMVDSRWLGRMSLLGAATLGYAVILTPILFVCWLAFFANELVTFPPQGYTLRWFAHIFDENTFVSGFATSLQVGIAAMIGGLLVGVPASLVLARRRFPGREALNTLLLLPLVVPGIVAGTAIYVFQIEVEIATGWPLLGSLAGLVLAHIMITIPWTVRLLTASLSGFDRSLEEAAMNLGATPLRAFLRITLPVIKPGVVAAALFGFIISFGNLEMTLFLVAPGQTTLPIAILQYLEWRIDPTIAAVSLLQIGLIGAGMLLTDRYVKLTRVL
ncbi:MAG TPA: ABC transporter permease [Casimicrobiaceae bacterium]|jgi:putative spermidine/putrescine transport system permease protein|nr:ABC transporter permease [Casimicrobiaceae bacterium]